MERDRALALPQRISSSRPAETRGAETLTLTLGACPSWLLVSDPWPFPNGSHTWCLTPGPGQRISNLVAPTDR